MRTTRLPSVTMPPDVSTVVVGGFPQLNKFEQFTSDCHQMLLAGGPMCHVRMAGGLMSGGWDWGVDWDGWVGPVQRVPMHHGHMGTPSSPWTDRHV